MASSRPSKAPSHFSRLRRQFWMARRQSAISPQKFPDKFKSTSNNSDSILKRAKSTHDNLHSTSKTAKKSESENNWISILGICLPTKISSNDGADIEQIFYKSNNRCTQFWKNKTSLKFVSGITKGPFKDYQWSTRVGRSGGAALSRKPVCCCCSALSFLPIPPCSALSGNSALSSRPIPVPSWL